MQTEGVPVYEQQNAIYNNRNFRYYIDEKKYHELKRFVVKNNDLIISCSGTVGKISLIQEEINVEKEKNSKFKKKLESIENRYLLIKKEYENKIKSKVPPANNFPPINKTSNKFFMDIKKRKRSLT